MSSKEPILPDLFIPKIGKASKCMGMLMDGRLSAIDLTLKQFILLTHVKSEGRAQSELVIITERDKGSLTRLIHSLERKQFVVRKGSKADKRINIIESTAEGRKALKKAEKIVLKTFEELKKGISKKDEQAVIDIAEKLMDNAHRLMGQPRPIKL